MTGALLFEKMTGAENGSRIELIGCIFSMTNLSLSIALMAHEKVSELMSAFDLAHCDISPG